jgi:hypothetical protein
VRVTDAALNFGNGHGAQIQRVRGLRADPSKHCAVRLGFAQF